MCHAVAHLPSRRLGPGVSSPGPSVGEAIRWISRSLEPKELRGSAWKEHEAKLRNPLKVGVGGNQLLTGINTAAVAEAAILGQRLGVELPVLLEVIATSYGSSTMLSRNLPRFMARDFQPGGTIDTFLKDLGLIRQEAGRHAAVLLLGSLTEQRFLAARYRGWGQEDLAAVVKLWEEDAGMAE